MEKKTINIEFPADILLALNETEEELKQHLKIELAVRLYKSGKLTIGKAAQIVGFSRLQFEEFLSKNEIPISNLTIDDVVKDTKKLR